MRFCQWWFANKMFFFLFTHHDDDFCSFFFSLLFISLYVFILSLLIFSLLFDGDDEKRALMFSCYFNVCNFLPRLPCFFFFCLHDFIFNLDKQNLFCDFLSCFRLFFFTVSNQFNIIFVLSLCVIDLLEKWQ